MTMRPYMVEVLGTPEAGKTTAIKEVIFSLKQKGHKVQYNRESRERVPEEFRRSSLEEHLWMKFNTMRNIMFAKACNAEIVLIDRGIYDTLIWDTIFCKRGEMSYKQVQLMESTAFSIDIRPDLVVAFITEAEEVISRRGGEGRIVTKQFIESYNKSVLEYCEEISPKPILFDTTRVTPDESAEFLERTIMTQIRNQIK